MQAYENREAYLQAVCTQMRWKKARQGVYEELECHLQDQTDAFVAQGFSEQEAEQKAIAEMGDAVSVGMALDQAHRPVPQWGLLLLTGVLFLAGMCCRLYVSDNQTWAEVVFMVGLGMAVFLGAYFLDFSIWIRYAKPIVCVAIGILVCGWLLQTPNVNGKPQFLFFSMTSFALWLPLVYVSLLCLLRQKKEMGALLAVMAYLGGICFLVPCALFSNTILFAISAGVALCMAVSQDWFGIGKKQGQKWLLLLVVVILTMGGLFFISRYHYFMYRFASNDPMGSGYLQNLFYYVWQDSRWLEAGVPESAFLQAILENTDGNLYLSQHHAILLEIGFRYGKVFVGVLLALFVLFFVQCWLQIRKQKAILANMTAKVIYWILLVQFLFSVVFQLGIPFLQSFSLPLISWGNSEILLNGMLMGFLLSVFRSGQVSIKWDVFPSGAKRNI